MFGLTGDTCSNCGAALEANPGSDRVVCKYCGATTIIQSNPASPPAGPPYGGQPYGGQPYGAPPPAPPPGGGFGSYPQPFGSPTPVGVRPGRSSAGTVVAIMALAIVVLVGGVASMLLRGGAGSLSTDTASRHPGTKAKGRGAARTDPSAPTLLFGAKGTEPGQLSDARFIAVGSKGSIFVGDWDTGRLQKFDAQGHFQKLAQAPKDRSGDSHITGLATDGAGHVYLTVGGNLLRYSAAALTLDKTVAGKWPDRSYQEVDCDSANRVYALQSGPTLDVLYRLDAQLRPTGAWKHIVKNVHHADPTMDIHLAVGGKRVYISAGFSKLVYVYDLNGKYLSRFGGDTLFTTTGKLALDGRHRAYVVNFGGVTLFSPSGAPLVDLEWDPSWGAPRDVALAPNGTLLAVTLNGNVVQLHPPAAHPG